MIILFFIDSFYEFIEIKTCLIPLKLVVPVSGSEKNFGPVSSLSPPVGPIGFAQESTHNVYKSRLKNSILNSMRCVDVTFKGIFNLETYTILIPNIHI